MIFGFYKRKTHIKNKFQISSRTLTKAEPVLSNDEFVWLNEGGQVINREVYLDGKPYFFRCYHRNKDGVTYYSELLYFYKKYEEYDFPYFCEELNYNEEVFNVSWFWEGKKR